MDNSRDIIIMLFMSLTIARDFYNRNQVQSNYLLKKNTNEYIWGICCSDEHELSLQEFGLTFSST